MRSEKNHLVSYIGSLISGSDYVYFVSYDGLKVKDVSEFRRQLGACGAECRVLKNTLIRKAGELLKNDELKQLPLTGGTALICGKGDVSATAKTIVEFGKKFAAVAPKYGFVEGTVLSATEVMDIASLPPKEVLQAQLLSVLQAPSRNLVSLLNAKAASVLNVLNAYKNKIEQTS
jgi:large subunit ribosomal protein L10